VIDVLDPTSSGGPDPRGPGARHKNRGASDKGSSLRTPSALGGEFRRGRDTVQPREGNWPISKIPASGWDLTFARAGRGSTRIDLLESRAVRAYTNRWLGSPPLIRRAISRRMDSDTRDGAAHARAAWAVATTRWRAPREGRPAGRRRPRYRRSDGPGCRVLRAAIRSSRGGSSAPGPR
jgi:hypothetical protein